MFGSQEAHWALHFVGYSKEILKDALSAFGFSVKKISYTSWKNTYNIEMLAKKVRSLSEEEIYVAAQKILSLYTIDETQGELLMLEKWKDDFKLQFQKSVSYLS